jgi:hypothetical protein
VSLKQYPFSEGESPSFESRVTLEYCCVHHKKHTGSGEKIGGDEREIRATILIMSCRVFFLYHHCQVPVGPVRVSSGWISR